MKVLHFQCRLLTEVVFNASLATEGNMKSLDYIPGSNFMGLVASQWYKKLADQDILAIFHSPKVSFGDAHLSEAGQLGYPMPLCLQLEKGKEDILKDKVWLHHLGKKPNVRLKSYQGGFFNAQGHFFKKAIKRFALKSAYDRDTRRSKDQMMFGLDALQPGQLFNFSIYLKEEAEQYAKLIQNALVGKRRLGKSRSAQYGQVEIKKLDHLQSFQNHACQGHTLVLYAASNWCFLNEWGMPCFQPDLKQFGLKLKGKINWQQSQVRTFSYSSWNGHRRGPNTQRDCIARGSVLVIDLAEQVALEDLNKMVGAYQNEGLGRVIYNPSFLKVNDEGHWAFDLKAYQSKEEVDDTKGQTTPQTPLVKYLYQEKIKRDKELEVGRAVLKFQVDHQKEYKDISSSQWGQIRKEAERVKSIPELLRALFEVIIQTDGQKVYQGSLVKGVAAKKYWDVNNGKLRTYLKQAIEANEVLGTDFLIKLAAEMAKSPTKNTADESKE